MNKYDTNELLNYFKMTVDLEGIKKLEEYIKNLEEENQQLKQWDKNKDTRNSKQRIANAKLIKENQQLKELLYTKNFKGDSPKIISIFEKADKGRINKLENIIKELRSWLEEETKEPISYNLLYDGKQKAYQEVISKLNELEGGKNENI